MGEHDKVRERVGCGGRGGGGEGGELGFGELEISQPIIQPDLLT